MEKFALNQLRAGFFFHVVAVLQATPHLVCNVHASKATRACDTRTNTRRNKVERGKVKKKRWTMEKMLYAIDNGKGWPIDFRPVSISFDWATSK